MSATHYFFTRIACDARTVCGPQQVPRSDDHIMQLIQTWRDQSMRFYYMQVGDPQPDNYRVVLRYSDMYQHLIDRFDWPAWFQADLTTKYPHQWIADNVPVLQPCSFTRVDCDDSFTNDFMAFLNSRMLTLGTQGVKRRLILYKKIRQLNMADGRITTIMEHMCPMFCSLLWPLGFPRSAIEACKEKYDKRHGPDDLLGLIGNHGKFHKLDHESPNRCFALMRITGINSANRLGLMGREWPEFKYEDKADERFTF